MRGATSIAVVVPCRNEGETIRIVLDAVAAQTAPPDEIVVVDDQSIDATAAIIDMWRAAHPQLPLRVIGGAGRGVAAALNTGIAACRCDVVVRLDGHSVPAPNYIETALRALSPDGTGIVGGMWVIHPGASTTAATAIAGVVSHPLGSGGAGYRDASTDEGTGATAVETVPFGVFRRELWQRLGGFDESLLTNEDYDFNYRARRAGYAVMLDRRIRSIYFARPTLAALARQYHRYGFWKARMLQKDPRALHARQVPPAFVLPWVVGSTAVAVLWPGGLTVTAALAYPAALVAGGAHVAAKLKTFGAWPYAVAALGVVHMAWSAGFLRALAAAPPRAPRQDPSTR